MLRLLVTILIFAVGCRQRARLEERATTPTLGSTSAPHLVQTSSAPTRPAATQPPTPEVMRVGGEVTEPLEIYRPRLEIPENLHSRKVLGILIFEAVIQADGSVSSVHLLRPDPAPTASLPCIHAYMKYLSSWRYKPATYRSKAVPVFLTVTAHHVPC